MIVSRTFSRFCLLISGFFGLADRTAANGRGTRGWNTSEGDNEGGGGDSEGRGDPVEILQRLHARLQNTLRKG